MISITISDKDAGGRFDKYLFKYFCNAPSSFIYKMLRKKNIVLNGAKASGREILKDGDNVKVFFSDDTIEKFSKRENSLTDELKQYDPKGVKMPEIVYEDENLLVINKPAGMLSQKSKPDDISANEICLSYLLNKNELTEESLKTFKPSVCNRLDTNTMGLLIFAKNYTAARVISKMLADRSIHKYYCAIAAGCISGEMLLEGRLTKDEANNKVSIKDVQSEGERIYTRIKPLASNKEISLLEILLITGKTHQIRAHLASIGHPIIGDCKYGSRSLNESYREKYKVGSQLLCAVRLEFPEEMKELSYLSGKSIEIEYPDIMRRIIKDGNMEIKRP